MERLKLNDGRVKITKQFVDKQPFVDDGQRYFYDRDLTGFGLVVGKRSKAYFAERTVKGKNKCRRITIGRHGPLTCDEARQRAGKLILQMADGIDPIEQERRDRQEAQVASITLKQLWEVFADERPHKTSTRSDYIKYMNAVFGGDVKDEAMTVTKKRKHRNKELPVAWWKRPISEISKEDIRQLHKFIGRELGKPSYANGSMRVLGALLNLAVAREWIDKNPTEVLSLEKRWFSEKPRKNTVGSDKLPDWFKALEDLRQQTDPPSAAVGADYLEFVLFTGLRRSEAAKLTWERVNFDAKTVTIDDTKNGDPLVLPMTDHLTWLLLRRKTAADRISSPWVFPSAGRMSGEGHLSEPRYIADLVEAAAGVNFTIHDLRRTFITVAAQLVPYPILKALVNHRCKSKGDVTLDYFSPKAADLAEPMQKITDYLLAQKAKGQGLKLAKAE